MKGIILAAGMGTRLHPLTLTRPKCLVKVAGKPMMEYQLDSLRAAGIQECTIVVGYLAESVKNHFGSSYRGIRLSYVENKAYKTTNNLYSFWLAKSEFTDDMLLMEGDLVFDDRLISELIDIDEDNIAVVDRFQPGMDGTLILADHNSVAALVLKSDQFQGFDYSSALKTVNIYRLAHETLVKTIVPEMDAFLAKGRADRYYEAVFGSLIESRRMEMSIMNTGAMKWAEIDTEDELQKAEYMLDTVATGIGLGRRIPTGFAG